MENKLLNQAGLILEEIRLKKPLIHHITNYVTANDCANIVLAIGASPVMADELEEVEDIVSISSALVLNIGTLNQRTVKSMIAAGKKANRLNIPVIFDPVGAGASDFRNNSAERIMGEVKISVLRGNLSEIRFVAGRGNRTKGVEASDADAAEGIERRRKIAGDVAKELFCVVAITGAVDVLTDGNRTITIKNGTKLLSGVTGTGCMCTSLIGAFCGASPDLLTAAAGGVLSMGIAGEIAAEIAEGKGNGSFHMAILDAISNLDAKTLAGRAKIHEA